MKEITSKYYDQYLEEANKQTDIGLRATTQRLYDLLDFVSDGLGYKLDVYRIKELDDQDRNINIHYITKMMKGRVKPGRIFDRHLSILLGTEQGYIFGTHPKPEWVMSDGASDLADRLKSVDDENYLGLRLRRTITSYYQDSVNRYKREREIESYLKSRTNIKIDDSVNRDAGRYYAFLERVGNKTRHENMNPEYSRPCL